MKEILITDFAHLQAEILDDTPGRNYIFRGVSKAKYTLVPSVGRVKSSRGNTSTLQLEKRLLQLFKESAVSHLDFKPSHDLEWLAVAQHHGLPTRLLDWSYNPLIATFFAVEKNDQDDAAVYLFWGASTIQDAAKVSPFTVKTIAKFRPPYLSSRIQNQAGLFTVHPEPSAAFDHASMKKIIIPAALKPGFRRKLFKFGVHNRLVYPGLDGVSADLKFLETL